MDLKKFKDFKKEKLTQKIKLEKFINKFIIGKEHVESVLKHQKYLFTLEDKNCIALLEQNKDQQGFSIGFNFEENGVKKTVLPVYLLKDKLNEKYSYLDYQFSSKEINNGLKEIFKEMPYYLLFDIKWMTMVRFKTKEDAIEFLKNNQNYVILQEKILKNFEIRDLIKSGQLNELKKRMIIQLYE